MKYLLCLTVLCCVIACGRESTQSRDQAAPQAPYTLHDDYIIVNDPEIVSFIAYKNDVDTWVYDQHERRVISFEGTGYTNMNDDPIVRDGIIEMYVGNKEFFSNSWGEDEVSAKNYETELIKLLGHQPMVTTGRQYFTLDKKKIKIAPHMKYYVFKEVKIYRSLIKLIVYPIRLNK